MSKTSSFPSAQFFSQLRNRIAGEKELFRRLGIFDARFGLKILAGGSVGRVQLFMFEFEADALNDVHEVDPSSALANVDFVLEASYEDWCSMLEARRNPQDTMHSINTLTHWDNPMRVDASDPAGYDKLYRYQASIQLLFDLAAQVEANS